MRLARLALALLASCVADPALVSLELPEVEGAKSVLVAFERGGEVVALHALDLSDDAPAASRRVPFTDREDQGEIALTAVFLERALDFFGLATGRLVKAEAGDEGAPIPPFQAAYGARVRGTETSGWAKVEELGPELVRLRIAGVTPERRCPRFTQEILPIEIGTDRGVDTRFALKLPDSRVLLGLETKRLWVVDAERRLQPMDTPEDLPTTQGATIAPDGRVWFVGHEGVARPARVTSRGVEDIERVPPSPRNKSLHFVVTGGSGASFELFTLSWEGLVEKFDGRVWTEVHDFAPPQFGSLGGLVRVGPDEVMATIPHRPGIIRYTRGVVREERTGAGSAAFTTIARLPSFGIVAALARGGLYRLKGEAWEHLVGSESSVLAGVLLEYRGGIFRIGEYGFAEHYVPGLGVCGSFQPAPDTTQNAVMLDGDTILIAGDQTADLVNVVLLRGD